MYSKEHSLCTLKPRLLNVSPAMSADPLTSVKGSLSVVEESFGAKISKLVFWPSNLKPNMSEPLTMFVSGNVPLPHPSTFAFTAW